MREPSDEPWIAQLPQTLHKRLFPKGDADVTRFLAELDEAEARGVPMQADPETRQEVMAMVREPAVPEKPRRRWAPDSTEEELAADIEAARAEDAIDGVLATAPEMTSRQAADIGRLLFSEPAPAPEPAPEPAPGPGGGDQVTVAMTRAEALAWLAEHR